MCANKLFVHTRQRAKKFYAIFHRFTSTILAPRNAADVVRLFLRVLIHAETEILFVTDEWKLKSFILPKCISAFCGAARARSTEAGCAEQGKVSQTAKCH